MPTHQFDTTTESKTRLTSVGQTPVLENATSVQASPAQSGRILPAHTVAARLAQSSGGHLARAGNALLQLQRLHGNGYVQQVVGYARQVAHRRAAPVIQTKLRIGPADDRYEREADRVSREVVRWTAQRRMTDGDGIERLSFGSGSYRSATSSASEPMRAEDQHAIQHARGRGQPLASRVREPMEQALGADFRGVRVHTDAQSDRLGRSLQASAFTVGRDIFFRRGNHDLGSRGGQELLAHELTHVVQQSDGALRRAAGNFTVGTPRRDGAIQCGGPVQSGVVVQRNGGDGEKTTQKQETNLGAEAVAGFLGGALKGLVMFPVNQLMGISRTFKMTGLSGGKKQDAVRIGNQQIGHTIREGTAAAKYIRLRDLRRTAEVARVSLETFQALPPDAQSEVTREFAALGGSFVASIGVASFLQKLATKKAVGLGVRPAYAPLVGIVLGAAFSWFSFQSSTTQSVALLNKWRMNPVSRPFVEVMTGSKSSEGE